MWAKNDTLAKVTSCEVSPVCRRLHWLAVSQLLRCGNDVAGALYGWLAGWLVGVKVTARTIVVFALLYASRAPSDPVLWLCSRGSITECEREREREREGRVQREACSVESIRIYRFSSDEDSTGRLEQGRIL